MYVTPDMTDIYSKGDRLSEDFDGRVCWLLFLLGNLVGRLSDGQQVDGDEARQLETDLSALVCLTDVGITFDSWDAEPVVGANNRRIAQLLWVGLEYAVDDDQLQRRIHQEKSAFMRQSSR